MGKSSKEKVQEKLSKYEKNSGRVSLYVNIQKKDINGMVTTVYSCDHSGMIPMSENEKIPLQKEFTDKEAFKAHITEMVDKFEGQL